MKRILAGLAVIAATTVIANGAFAQGRMGRGCSGCGPDNAQTEQFRKFQQETLDLRQEMMNKRFDLQRENLKGAPDAGKIAALRADIAAVRAKINDIRVQNGLPDNQKRDGECFSERENCGKNGAMGGCNGKPCGEQPCYQQAPK